MGIKSQCNTGIDNTSVYGKLYMLLFKPREISKRQEN